jgi:hypothetical protein
LQAGFNKLKPEERETFERVKLQTQKIFAKKMMSLREGENFRNALGERMEDNQPESLVKFISKFESLLNEFAKPTQAKWLTSFSLPEGRQPALIDEWVFLKFQPTPSKTPRETQEINLIQVPQFVQSLISGQRISPAKLSTRATMRHEDFDLEEFLLNNPLPTEQADLENLHNRTLFASHDTPAIRSTIANPHLTTTSNSTCISCHKLNNLKFDFHNFSYLEDRPLTVAPRVVEDAKAELSVWTNLFSR